VRLVGLAVVALASGCIMPFATPPLRGELGRSSRLGHEGDRGGAALHGAVGAHLASATTRGDQAFDVGVGWLVEHTPDQTSHGAYLDGAVFVERGRRARTSAGVRGELRSLVEGTAVAAKLRLDTELYGGGHADFRSDDRCASAAGTFYGTTAIGLFVEAGREWSTGMTEAAWVASAGVSIRLPSTVGIAIGIPYCR